MVREVVAKQKLNWRSWWTEGTDGAIPRQWNVVSWPTFFVIDAQGIVRHQITTGADLEPIIEALVRETEQSPRR